MGKMFKKELGITLVALVITIIILLILAGISISTLTGSGLFEKAREAEAKSKNAQNEENAIVSSDFFAFFKRNALFQSSAIRWDFWEPSAKKYSKKRRFCIAFSE